MYKTLIYTLVNGKIKGLAHRKHIEKRWYYSAAH